MVQLKRVSGMPTKRVQIEQVSIVILLIFGFGALTDIFALDVLDLLIVSAAFSAVYYFGYQKIRVSNYRTAQACFVGLVIDAGGFFVYTWVLGNVAGMAYNLVILLAAVYAISLTNAIRSQTKTVSTLRALPDA